MPIKTLIVDIEDRIEKEIDLAARAARAGDKCLWIAGFHAVRIVGLYKVNATRNIALKAGRSESTVENWAHAVSLMNDMREAGYSAEIKYFRKVFTPTHFWTMWDLRNKYGLEPDKVMGYFGILIAHKVHDQPHGAGVLEREVEALEKESGNVPTWDYLQKRLQNWYAGVMVAPDAPAEVREWLRLAPECVKESK